MRIFAIVLVAVLGSLGALLAAAAAFIANPGNVYCLPVDPANPEGACELTAIFFLATAGGFVGDPRRDAVGDCCRDQVGVAAGGAGIGTSPAMANTAAAPNPGLAPHDVMRYTQG
jgi:hypothetical protein